MKNLEEDFVPYEEAIALRELGFNKPCMGVFALDKNGFERCGRKTLWTDVFDTWVKTPTWKVAFKWFRENKGLYGTIVPQIQKKFHYDIWRIFDENNSPILSERVIFSNRGYKTPEKAELECLRELIKISNRINNNSEELCCWCEGSGLHEMMLDDEGNEDEEAVYELCDGEGKYDKNKFKRNESNKIKNNR